ncbi:HNH endonuclease signature motif containing protein [Pseudomonas plecoglossicida]|uniref:HNH endonuclease signature motif containing protein n=1 Tax=Pseudomonas plecoglossicida TaxID=70775 RepID=UPI003D203955
MAKPSRPETVRAGLAVYESPRWIKLSAQLRKEVGHCEQCGRSDGQLYVDHVVELQDGGDPWHRTNLMVLCAHCHTTKTRAAAKDRAWRPLAEQLEDQLRQVAQTQTITRGGGVGRSQRLGGKVWRNGDDRSRDPRSHA